MAWGSICKTRLLSVPASGLRQEARHDLLAESRKHAATNLLCQIPYIGPIRAALLKALIQTPHRFRTKNNFARTAVCRWRRTAVENTTLCKVNRNDPTSPACRVVSLLTTVMI